MILATDLDGTFAGGTSADRSSLQAILATRPDTLLIYVTGRSLAATRSIISEASLPDPDILIADVGTTVLAGRPLTPVPEVEAQIAAAWPGGAVIRDRLADLYSIVEQEVRSPRRVSYTIPSAVELAAASLSPVELRGRPGGAGSENEQTTSSTSRDPRDDELSAAMEAARARLAGLSVDLIGSAGIYLDVLPRGINKGTTLRRVLGWLGREEESVLTAGDSLNDLALLEAGFPGVAVGNSEEGLLRRAADNANVHVAGGHGAAGIIEALEHFGWLDQASSCGAPHGERATSPVDADHTREEVMDV